MDNSTKINKGIVYIAFNHHPKANHIHELLFSVKTVKQSNPSLPITVYSDTDIKSDHIDNVIITNITSSRMKQIILPKSPYDVTLYLDTDTAVVDNLDSLFRITERFELAACFDYLRYDPDKAAAYKPYRDIPESFSEFGGGVILFKKCPNTDAFFKLWQKNYEDFCKKTKWKTDQQTFRLSIWQSKDLKFYVLPPEYNLRTQEKRDSCKSRFPIKDKIYHWHHMQTKGLSYKPYQY